MAYNEILADRIREWLAFLPNIQEKAMMGGLTFMYNDKMCVGVFGEEMMCRVDPEIHEKLIEKRGCRTMDFTNKPMMGYVMIDETGMASHADFEYWINLSLDYNPKAKSSIKKKTTLK